MSTGDGVIHNTEVVIEQGGNVEDIQAGGVLDVQASATEEVEGTENLESGAILNVKSGAIVKVKSGGVVNIETGGALQVNAVDVTAALAAIASDLTDNQKIIGIENVLINSVGTWTRTRVAEGDYVLRHTAADDTSVIGIDITEAIRTTASKGLKLASIDVIHKIGTLALDAHTLTLDKVAYANNVATAVTSVPLTGSLNTATQANPYVDNIAVTTPAFDNTAASKYFVELTVNAAATSAYDFMGLNLHFTKSQS
jgi:hypothetical protein